MSLNQEKAGQIIGQSVQTDVTYTCQMGRGESVTGYLAVASRAARERGANVEPNGTAEPARPKARADWLAQTKLHAPGLRQDLVPRQRLLSALYDVLTSHSLTLLSAPAGYGKTTLLAALPDAFSELRLAWLSLDEDDNDPVHLLAAAFYAPGRDHTA